MKEYKNTASFDLKEVKDMKRWRVAVEEFAYYGIYVDAETAADAEKKVKEMLNNGNYIYDDDGDSGVTVVEGETYEIE